MAKPMRKPEESESIVQHLTQVLSDTYVLAVKAHVYHWNVVGSSFGALHAFFEGQYKGLTDTADEIAERIRALGPLVEGGMTAFLKNTVIKEAETGPMDAKAMLKDYLHSCQQLRDRCAETEDVADDLDDVVTQDLMVGRLAELDKVMWMLKSYL